MPDGIDATASEEKRLQEIVKMIKEAVDAQDWYVGLKDGVRDLKRFQTLKHHIGAEVRAELSECLYGVVTRKDPIDQLLTKSICQVNLWLRFIFWKKRMLPA
jgi:hypothetical protein